MQGCRRGLEFHKHKGRKWQRQCLYPSMASCKAASLPVERQKRPQMPLKCYINTVLYICICIISLVTFISDHARLQAKGNGWLAVMWQGVQILPLLAVSPVPLWERLTTVHNYIYTKYRGRHCTYYFIAHRHTGPSENIRNKPKTITENKGWSMLVKTKAHPATSSEAQKIARY